MMETDTKKIEIGTINVQRNAGEVSFNLLDRIIIYEALKEYQTVLSKNPKKVIIADTEEILYGLLQYFSTVEMNDYMELGCVSIEDIKKWSAHGFGSELIELRQSSDVLPF